MAVINFNEIDFNKSINKDCIKINFNESEILILPYISINDKYDLIMNTLLRSFEDGIYNAIKLEMCFTMNIIYKYTNIIFSEEELKNEVALYDVIHNSGLKEMILAAMNPKELEVLQLFLNNVKEDSLKVQGTFGAILNGLLKEIPQLAEKAKEVLKEINPEKIENIKQFLANFKQAE